MELIDKIIYAFLCAIPALAFLVIIVFPLIVKSKPVVIDESWTTPSPNSAELREAVHVETLNWRDKNG